MLDGSENEVTGLLAQLFATEGSAITQPEFYREADHLKRSGPESKPEMLSAIEKAKAALGTPAFSDAFAALMSTPNKNGRTPEATIAGALGQFVKDNQESGRFTSEDAQIVANTVRAAVAESLGNFDPALANFTAWVGTSARNAARDYIRDEKKHRGVASIGGGRGDDGVGVDPSSDRRLSAPDAATSRAVFTKDEEKLCAWLSDYFNKIIDGKEPAFFDVKMDRHAGDAEAAGLAVLSPEDRVKRLKEIERARLFAFMTHHGIGAKKMSFLQLAKTLNDVYRIPNFTTSRGNQWYPTIWKRLVNLVTAEAGMIGIAIDPSTNQRDIEYPGRVLATFKAKMNSILKHHGVKSGAAACEDDLSNGLSDLLSVLESWHATANG